MVCAPFFFGRAVKTSHPRFKIFQRFFFFPLLFSFVLSVQKVFFLKMKSGCEGFSGAVVREARLFFFLSLAEFFLMPQPVSGKLEGHLWRRCVVGRLLSSCFSNSPTAGLFFSSGRATNAVFPGRVFFANPSPPPFCRRSHKKASFPPSWWGRAYFTGLFS